MWCGMGRLLAGQRSGCGCVVPLQDVARVAEQESLLHADAACWRHFSPSHSWACPPAAVRLCGGRCRQATRQCCRRAARRQHVVGHRQWCVWLSHHGYVCACRPSAAEAYNLHLPFMPLRTSVCTMPALPFICIWICDCSRCRVHYTCQFPVLGRWPKSVHMWNDAALLGSGRHCERTRQRS